jgi:hypothetical protein
MRKVIGLCLCHSFESRYCIRSLETGWINTSVDLDLEILLNEINLLINSFPKRDLKTL